MAGEDDRESDVGEVSSPMSQDHQKLPMDEKIKKDGEVSVKEIKIEDELGKKDGIIDHDDEANSASYEGGSSRSSGGSSSSSSDDEVHRVKKGQAESSIASVGSVELAESSIAAEGGDLVVESIPAAISEKITVSSELVESAAPSPADIAVAPRVIESTLEQHGKKKCCSVKERISTSEPSVNAASHGKGEANSQSAEACVTVAQENDDRSTSPDIASTADVDNGAQHVVKDSVLTQVCVVFQPVEEHIHQSRYHFSFEHKCYAVIYLLRSNFLQLVAAPSPYPIQKTSWKGCCGLFEVFSSSGA